MELQKTETKEREPLSMESPLDYITVSEIQSFLGIGLEHAYALVKSKYFPSFKLGKQNYVVPRIAFMKFITDPDKIVEYKIKTYENP